MLKTVASGVLAGCLALGCWAADDEFANQDAVGQDLDNVVKDVNETGPTDQSSGKSVVDIGNRLELFIDGFLVDTLSGGAVRRMHHPLPRNIIHTLDQPWEGRTSAYLSIVEDAEAGEIRLYYNATPEGPARQTTGLLVSKDGIHFTRPELNLYDHMGDTRNNLLPISKRFGAAGHNFTPFIDTREDVPPDARYKAIGYLGFSVYASPDGLDWRRLVPRAISGGPFDSQNLAFWDPLRQQYVGYMRAKPEERGRIRDIRTSTSPDALAWTEPQLINYKDDRLEHMYINSIRPYFRAPHIYIGLPNRLVPSRKKVDQHPNPGVSDIVLMSSRDGLLFERWPAAFLRPGPEPEVWTDRNNYPAWGMVQTAPDELSLYWTEHYRHPGMRIRRGTIRVDGFASVGADGERGELLTRPFVFTGDRLIVNYASSANGDLRFELTDTQGEPLPGFSLQDSELLYGNEIEHMVAWQGQYDLSALQGQAARLRVNLHDADLYSIRFADAREWHAKLLHEQEAALKLLADIPGKFGDTTRTPLFNAASDLARLMTAVDLTPEMVAAVAELRRAQTRAAVARRAGDQARQLLDTAMKLRAVEVAFGRVYLGAVKVLEEDLARILRDPAAAVHDLEVLNLRLSGALHDYDQKVSAFVSEAQRCSAQAEELLSEPRVGFGALFQNLIERRHDQLRAVLDDPQATAAVLQTAVTGQREAMARFAELAEYPPVPVHTLPALPTVYEISRDQWSEGLLVNTRVDGDDLVLSGELSLGFAGADDYVVVPAADALKTPLVTVEAWVKIDNPYLQWIPVLHLGRLPGTEEAWTEHAYNLWIDRDVPQFTLGSPDAANLVRTKTGNNLVVGDWQHLAGQYDGRQLRLYINGKLARAVDHDGGIDYTCAEVLRIGGSAGKYSGFEGRIRDVRVWNTVRSEQEIRENMHARLTGTEEGLAGLWIVVPQAGTAEEVYNHVAGGPQGLIKGAAWNERQGYRLGGPINLAGAAVPK
ncbi:MAG: LamG domain-containing protein, partial [Lentisphaerae bacterium]|nr:LamG domain-containing protein [Lentisphaerota bacterium]